MPVDKTARLLRRFAQMSGDEICTRGVQEITKRLDRIKYAAGASFAETPLAETLTGGQTAQFFFPAGMIPGEVTIDPSVDRILKKRFALLGYENLFFGDPIDW